jgi:serine/threonine protein kinase
VQLMHLNGFYHSDLKPDNIVIVRENDGSKNIRVIDFGIATSDFLTIIGSTELFFHSSKRKYINQGERKLPYVDRAEERLGIELYTVGRTIL